MDTQVLHPMRTARSFVRLTALLVVLTGAIGLSQKSASAWTAGYSGNSTLYACNWNGGIPLCQSFPWTASATIDYTKVWQSGIGYTVVNSLIHQVKTSTNWSGYSGYISGTISTTMYSGGTYMATVAGWTLNGSCLIPPWVCWGCDSGT